MVAPSLATLLVVITVWALVERRKWKARALGTLSDAPRGRPLPVSQGCTLPPPGWYCTRKVGHDGPCAAYPNWDDPRR